MTKPFNRRSFLKYSSLATTPLVIPTTAFRFEPIVNEEKIGKKQINFITDSPLWNAKQYSEQLKNAVNNLTNVQDFYGYGGAVTQLCDYFAKATGKERAVYLPTGTLANNLAIKVLSGNKTKVVVQETSHLFRDEADAAQAIHSKRLIELNLGQEVFTLEDLQKKIDYLKTGEVVRTPIGVVSIEIPVRRTDNSIFPFEELKKIAAYCKANQIKLHLDGARIHIASAYSDIPLQAYAELFDTAYISLYKYLGAAGGAILCGDASVINEVTRLMKIYGGTVYQNWPNAAIALSNVKNIDKIWKDAKAKGIDLLNQIEKTKHIRCENITNGSNMSFLYFNTKVDYNKLTKFLEKEKNFLLRTPGIPERIRFFINESILYRSNEEILKDFVEGINYSKV
jgi:threonine aldolase